MTDGFAMLLGWLGWLGLLAALCWAVMRRTTKRAPTGYEETDDPDRAAPPARDS